MIILDGKITSTKSSWRFATKLSGYVWNLKDQEINHNIRWKIKKKAKPYNPITKMCNLCLTEKVMIMEADRNIYLNDRTEILAKCRHANKYKLESLLKWWGLGPDQKKMLFVNDGVRDLMCTRNKFLRRGPKIHILSSKEHNSFFFKTAAIMA